MNVLYRTPHRRLITALIPIALVVAVGALIQGRAGATSPVQEDIALTPAHAPPTATPTRPAPAQSTAAEHARPQYPIDTHDVACDGDDSPACTVDDAAGGYYPIAVSADLTPEPFRVDHSPDLCDYPDIHAGRVVYEDHRGPGIEIYGWDLAADEEFQVIHDFHHQHFPVIHGDVVAYTDLRYSTTGLDGTDVFARDLATGQEVTVTTAPGQQINLAIGARYIVWEDDRDGNTGRGLGSQRDIYGYDLVTDREFPRFYRGDPQADGVFIGETVVTVESGAAQPAEISWQSDVTGDYYLYALADPEDQLLEWREENNVRRTEVSLGRTSFIYLPLMMHNR